MGDTYVYMINFYILHYKICTLNYFNIVDKYLKVVRYGVLD